MAYKLLTKGRRHLISLGSPFLKSSNALACFRKIESIDSAESHASISEASWWLRRSFPVFLEYSARAASKIAWKLEDVIGADDMMRETSNVARGRRKGKGELRTTMRAEICVVVEAAYPSVGYPTNSPAHSVTACPSPGPRKGGGVALLIKPLTSYLVSLRRRNVCLASNQRPS